MFEWDKVEIRKNLYLYLYISEDNIWKSFKI